MYGKPSTFGGDVEIDWFLNRYAVCSGIAMIFPLVSASRNVMAMRKGKMQPHRIASWGMVFVCFMNVAFAWGAGGKALWYPFMALIGFLMIAIGSIWYGERDVPLSPLERSAFSTAVVIVPIYFFLKWNGLSEAALLGLVLMLAVDAVLFAPIMEKVWKRPHTEDRTAWWLSLPGPTVNYGAIHWNDIRLDEVTTWLHPDLIYNTYIFVLVTFALIGLHRYRT